METAVEYFKMLYSTGEIMNVVKAKKHKSIGVTDAGVRIHFLGQKYYEEDHNYVKATREEFQSLYNTAVETFKKFEDERVLEKA